MSRPETHVLRPAVAPVDLNQHPVRLANLVAQYMGRAPNGNSPGNHWGSKPKASQFKLSRRKRKPLNPQNTPSMAVFLEQEVIVAVN
jgi:hypothetical protein